MSESQSLMSQITNEEAGIKPFHEWKTEQYARDQRNHTPHEKEWYYTQYGGYCEVRRRIGLQKRELLQELTKCDFVFFDNRFKLGRWIDTINELVNEGKIKTEMNEIEEQYSRLEIRLVK